MRITNIAGEGMGRAVTKLETATRSLAVAGRQPEPAVQDSVDLSGSAVLLIRTRTEFEANVRAFETSGELTKKTLDLLG